jgi:exodeoxyribonuclease VII large subunit
VGILERRLTHLGAQLVAERRRKLDTLSSKLDALSPLKVLDRGYSLTRGPDGNVVKSRRGLAVGDELVVTLADGDLRAKVAEILAGRSHKP